MSKPKLCSGCDQPMLPKGQRRKHPDDYRHATGCPLAPKPKRKTRQPKREPHEEVPTNWLDPLLTGPESVIGRPPYGCSAIERLLVAVRERVRSAER